MGGIIWLASYPKSGNTWLRTFLHNLLLNTDQPANLNELTKLTIGDGNKFWYEKFSGKPFDSLSEEEVAALIPRIHKAYSQTRSDSVFVKTHSGLGSYFDVPLITPEYTAGAIYIVRNPLDVVISLSDHYGMSIDMGIEMLANPQGHSAATDRKVVDHLGSWSAHVDSWMVMKKPFLHVMRYEDMLYKPEKTFGAVAKFLGIKPPKERLRKAIKFSSFAASRKQEEEKGFIEQSDKAERFFRVGKAGQWKTALTPSQVEQIVEVHYDVMEKFKYIPPNLKK
ncbi:sulfotransferase domain-containing protein [Sneathiella sp.]|uniref:sulfotransferase domain-containing protein n=1 Tax=Sneathiella sp. TaxID=1964365 RepID=UPI0035690AC7